MEYMDIKEIRMELKKILIGYRSLTKGMCKKLNKLGFVIVDGGKHYKVKDAKNHCIGVISKTPSDFRSGQNMVSCLCRGILRAQSMCIQ